jgi:hypothetical protein
VVFRASGLARAWGIGFTLFWCGALVALTMRDWPVSPSLLLLRGGGLLLAGWFAYRMVGVHVAAAGDVLVVRNLWRTRRLKRAEVRRVWLGEPLTAELPGGFLPGPRGEAVNIEGLGKAFTIDATRNWPGTRRLHRRLEALVVELERWRQAR